MSRELVELVDSFRTLLSVSEPLRSGFSEDKVWSPARKRSEVRVETYFWKRAPWGVGYTGRLYGWRKTEVIVLDHVMIAHSGTIITS